MARFNIAMFRIITLLYNTLKGLYAIVTKYTESYIIYAYVYTWI